MLTLKKVLPGVVAPFIVLAVHYLICIYVEYPVIQSNDRAAQLLVWLSAFVSVSAISGLAMVVTSNTNIRPYMKAVWVWSAIFGGFFALLSQYLLLQSLGYFN